eukprot:scaffold113636_cov54-Phaeocystis_antarctica.AAC.1
MGKQPRPCAGWGGVGSAAENGRQRGSSSSVAPGQGWGLIPRRCPPAEEHCYGSLPAAYFYSAARQPAGRSSPVCSAWRNTTSQRSNCARPRSTRGRRRWGRSPPVSAASPARAPALGTARVRCGWR